MNARSKNRSTAIIAAIAFAEYAAILAIFLGPWYGMLLAINVVAFFCYGWDKYKAVRNSWRIPEAMLLGLAAIGGAAGSLAGQLTFRHKTSKTRFKLAFWSIVIVQAAAAASLIIWAGYYRT